MWKATSVLLVVGFMLAIYLPLFGLSLIAVLAGDQMLLRLSPRISKWLGQIATDNLVED